MDLKMSNTPEENPETVHIPEIPVKPEPGQEPIKPKTPEITPGTKKADPTNDPPEIDA